MLEEVRIRNLGVIADATLPLGPGLTVVTGETGAGKTMVVAGLNLLFGARSDTSQISRGASTAEIDGVLVVAAESAAAQRCVEAGGALDENRLMLSRTISAEGRSRAYAGGRSVPVGVLAEIGERELIVHGQATQLRLARPGEQRSVLDRFGGAAHAAVLERYQAAFEEWQRLVRRLADLQRSDSDRQRELAMLRLGLDQVDRAQPRPQEDVEVDDQVRLLSNADELRHAVAAAAAALDGAEESFAADGADASLALAHRSLTDTADPSLTELADRLAALLVEVRDISSELAAYAAQLRDDPERLAELMNRKAELRDLVRSYSSTGDLDGVLAWADQARAQLADLDDSAEHLAQLGAQVQQAEAHAVKQATALTEARTRLARRLQKNVNAELASLALGGSRIIVQVSPRPPASDTPTLAGAAATEHGCDRVQILLAHGPNDDGRPLEKGASGGELSRIMLAIEVVLAGTDPVAAMVFDEVDAGVGGESAIEIGRRLAALSDEHQVIVVTHLPQVAAYADRHVKITKRAHGEVISSDIALLDDSERLDELTRMLAGLSDSESGRAHAAELIGAADHDKKRRTPR